MASNTEFNLKPLLKKKGIPRSTLTRSDFCLNRRKWNTGRKGIPGNVAELKSTGRTFQETPADAEACGSLSIVATPIGNLEDITLRALRVLREADTILCEDTRRTRILCTKFEIGGRLESYHIFNEHGRTPELIRRIRGGEKIALVSDAGMPCIADPGFLLVREAVAAGIEPEIVPGASALIFSIAASALPSDRFAFHGFLPVKQGRRAARLTEIAAMKLTAVLFESPYRLSKLLKEIPVYFGPETPVVVVREATKVHQEILRGSAQDLADRYGKRSWKGECVVVVGAPAETEDENGEE